MVREGDMTGGVLPMDGPRGSWGGEGRRPGEGDELLDSLGPGHMCLGLGYNGWLYREGEGADRDLAAWALACLRAAGADGMGVLCHALVCGGGRATLLRGLWATCEGGDWDGWERGAEAVVHVNGREWRCAIARGGLSALSRLLTGPLGVVTYLGPRGTEWSAPLAADLLRACLGEGEHPGLRECELVLDAGAAYLWTYGDPGAGPTVNFVWREGAPLAGLLARAARAAPGLAPPPRSYARRHLP